jgi:protein TonB
MMVELAPLPEPATAAPPKAAPQPPAPVEELPCRNWLKRQAEDRRPKPPKPKAKPQPPKPEKKPEPPKETADRGNRRDAAEQHATAEVRGTGTEHRVQQQRPASWQSDLLRHLASTRSTRKTLAVAARKASTACASWSTPKARWCRTRWPVARAAPRWTGRPGNDPPRRHGTKPPAELLNNGTIEVVHRSSRWTAAETFVSVTNRQV